MGILAASKEEVIMKAREKKGLSQLLLKNKIAKARISSSESKHICLLTPLGMCLFSS